MVRIGKVSRALGGHGERLAAEYLRANGMRIVERNWRCPHGELDIVAFDESTCEHVIVEVKTKSGPGFGAPLEAITAAKVRKLYQLAHLWRTANAELGRFRVDGVGVTLGGATPTFTHLKGISI